jgi:hypothetical protein
VADGGGDPDRDRDRAVAGLPRDRHVAWAADRPQPTWLWYPDSLAQLWPVSDGLGPAPRRATAWAASTRGVAGLDGQPSRVRHDLGGPRPDAAVYAAARSGDKAGLDAYLTRSDTGWAGGPAVNRGRLRLPGHGRGDRPLPGRGSVKRR